MQYEKIMLKMITSILFMLLLFILTGCFKEEELETGFNYDLSPDALMIAVKSEYADFNTDDVTLNFYYGSGSVIGELSDENYERIGFSVYFANSKYFNDIVNSTTPMFDDYKAIEGIYFIKEITEEELFSDYTVEVKMFSGKTFNHHESLTIPKEVFELSKGYFCMIIMEIYYSQKDDAYYVGEMGYQALHYERIDDNTVRLSKPKSSVLLDPS